MVKLWVGTQRQSKTPNGCCVRLRAGCSKLRQRSRASPGGPAGLAAAIRAKQVAQAAGQELSARPPSNAEPRAQNPGCWFSRSVLLRRARVPAEAFAPGELVESLRASLRGGAEIGAHILSGNVFEPRALQEPSASAIWAAKGPWNLRAEAS